MKIFVTSLFHKNSGHAKIIYNYWQIKTELLLVIVLLKTAIEHDVGKNCKTQIICTKISSQFVNQLAGNLFQVEKCRDDKDSIIVTIKADFWANHFFYLIVVIEEKLTLADITL